MRVGHATLLEGDNIRTGVTAILPHSGNLFQEKVPGAVFVGNAFGKLAGSTQVDELGTIETPVILTNTLSVAAGMEGAIAYTLGQPGNERVASVNALVGETNDGGLNDIRGMHVRREHVLEAIRAAKDGPVAEGSVGAGTGTQCYGWKGGIGTSSRKAGQGYGGYTVGVLVQTNFGGILTMGGAPVGRELGKYAYSNAGQGDGSCMIVVATDAPMTSRDLKRLAARAVFGLARTGSSYSNGSGDFAIAFSTAAAARIRPGMEPAKYEALPADARVAAVRDGAGGHRGGGVQLAAAGDDGAIQAGEGGGNPGGAGARDPEEVRRGEVAATSARCRGDTRPGTPRCRA